MRARMSAVLVAAGVLAAAMPLVAHHSFAAEYDENKRVKLQGTKSNRDGIGARVTLVTSSGERITRMVKSGSSYLSQSELPVTLGLGKPGKNAPVKIEIVWPSGAKQTVDSIKANTFVTVREGKGIVSSEAMRFGGAGASVKP